LSKHTIYLSQVNNRFGSEVFLPYSVGVIQSYCQQFDVINEVFNFKEFIYLKEDIKQLVDKLDNPSIIGISCFIWNWEYNKALAKSIKIHYPNCLIVMGGPHIPKEPYNFFHEHPYVDIIVHGEGEIAFYDILCEYIKTAPDYTQIPGLSVKFDGINCFKTRNRESFIDLKELPSPYLQGIFDELIRLPNKWNACHETNRGCPYSCVFCSWGSMNYRKLQEFPFGRLEEELEWFGKNKIEVLYNCDSNYGILKRDYNITQKLVEVKRKYDFPNHFRPTFAKNNNQDVFEIAKLLNEANFQKGITLSMQSMNEECLKNIKRKNIKTDSFQNLINLYRHEKIPTYTEIIMGLPGETYKTFKKGIAKLFQLGQHEGCYIYMCQLLPNSEMANSDYIKDFSIKAVKMPMLLAYTTPKKDTIREFFDIVVETKSLSIEYWKKCFIFAWATQCFHCMNLTQYLAIFMWNEFKIDFDDFYENILEFAMEYPHTLVGKQYLLVRNIMDKWLDGESIDVVVEQFGETTWNAEEASFLNIVSNKNMFYLEVEKMMIYLLKAKNLFIQKELLYDLINYQKNMLVDPFTPETFSMDFKYNLPEYFDNAYFGIETLLEKKDCNITFTKDHEYINSLKSYSLEVVRYGRKSNKLHHTKNVI
jgi:radical SAM superfamily enzyme YgiQ (UPF0313 family)